ncbi:MAG: hypothetical protein JNL38_28805, partial [Myxococcales bacterium]|nr:hypothetical protein [Myxococcales bacterium]
KTPSGTYVVATTFEGTTTRELSANGELLRESGSSRGEALSAALARDIGAAPAEGPRERELERRPGTASGLAPQGFFEAVGCVGNIIGFATSPGWGTGLRMVASCASTAQDVNDAYAQGIADCLDAGGLYCGLH